MKADQPNAAQLEAHKCHKDRLKRIASAAVKETVEVVAPIEVEAPVEAAKPPEPKWADRQKEIWFSIVADKQIKPPSVERIIAECAKHFGRSRLDLLCARRTQDVAIPRQIAMYLAKNMTMKSLPEIGRRFSNRDHTTVLHSVRKIARLIHSDSDLAFDVAHIELSLEAA